MGKYWEFKNKSDIESDLYLYSEIDSWGDGEYAHSAKSFKNELDSLGDIGTLNIYINSPGGDVFEGVSIANMLKRKIEQALLEWKNTPGHSPLIIKGCRQCGKTYSVRAFAKQNYKHVDSC